MWIGPIGGILFETFFFLFLKLSSKNERVKIPKSVSNHLNYSVFTYYWVRLKSESIF